MGKARIVSHLGGGLYNVELHHIRTKVDAKITRLTENLARIEADIATNTANKTDKQSEVETAWNNLQGFLNAYSTCLKTHNNDKDKCKNEYRVYIEKLTIYKEAIASLHAIEKKLDTLYIQQGRINQDITVLNTAHGQWTAMNIWCADLCDGDLGDSVIASGTEVATIDIYSFSLKRYEHWIVPSSYGRDNSYTAADDGTIKSSLSNSPAGFIYNWCMLGPQMAWSPRYRLATITGINRGANTASVSFFDLTDGDGVNYNGNESSNDIRIDYMICNHNAFSVGDAVIVSFCGDKFDNPLIIGFYANPKDCQTRAVLVGQKCDGAGGYNQKLVEDGEVISSLSKIKGSTSYLTQSSSSVGYKFKAQLITFTNHLASSLTEIVAKGETLPVGSCGTESSSFTPVNLFQTDEGETHVEIYDGIAYKNYTYQNPNAVTSTAVLYAGFYPFTEIDEDTEEEILKFKYFKVEVEVYAKNIKITKYIVNTSTDEETVSNTVTLFDGDLDVNYLWFLSNPDSAFSVQKRAWNLVTSGANLAWDSDGNNMFFVIPPIFAEGSYRSYLYSIQDANNATLNDISITKLTGYSERSSGGTIYTKIVGACFDYDDTEILYTVEFFYTENDYYPYEIPYTLALYINDVEVSGSKITMYSDIAASPPVKSKYWDSKTAYAFRPYNAKDRIYCLHYDEYTYDGSGNLVSNDNVSVKVFNDKTQIGSWSDTSWASAGKWERTTSCSAGRPIAELNGQYIADIAIGFENYRSVINGVINDQFTDSRHYTVGLADILIDKIVNIKIVSNNDNQYYGKSGDTITLTFTQTVPISVLTCSIAGSSVAPSKSGDNYTATYVVAGTESESEVQFNITADGDSFQKTSGSGRCTKVIADFTKPTLTVTDNYSEVYQAALDKYNKAIKTCNTSYQECLSKGTDSDVCTGVKVACEKVAQDNFEKEATDFIFTLEISESVKIKTRPYSLNLTDITLTGAKALLYKYDLGNKYMLRVRASTLGGGVNLSIAGDVLEDKAGNKNEVVNYNATT